MKHRKACRTVILFLCMILICGCVDNSQNGESTSTIHYELPLIAEPATGTLPLYPNTDRWPEEYIQKRDTWNIELSLKSYDDECIMLKMVDKDNKGCYLSHWYFILEYFENGEWVKISNLKEYYAWYQLVYCIPQSREYYEAEVPCNLVLLPQNTVLKSGHYRITKIIDNQPFSCEFDLNFD